MRVGTLLSWADRILSFVENGDFLSAIDLARSYYVGEAPGNRNGLPDKQEDLKAVVGEKMRDLMVASARYAFSEERMMDGTHYTPDGRGVDRTSLFEGLVVTCARACAALDDFDFLFEDLYSYYDNWGIARIYLTQLEPFVLDGTIHNVPPRITQKLIALHDEQQRPDLAERIIWHIDPECLDINQSILLCQRYQLYDALLYVYMRAMKDYVSPLVELLDLIRQVQRYRRRRAEASPSSRAYISDTEVEDIGVNAYKVYPYLGNVLTGLTYPSGEPLPEEDAEQAKYEVYRFVFAGRSTMWPEGESGRLILTNDEENGVEPTYPYARLLLRFDAEAFLHTLDLAFEDHYLNDDESHNINRLIIVKILLEILSSPETSQNDATFINIFIARNVPKYPQFIEMAPSVLHGILIALTEDPDESTREDRQLAAEYLLSAYTPHDGDRLARLFEQAGFYRILRSWHRHERQWAPLIQAYLRDSEVPTAEKFTSLDEVIATASKSHKGQLPPEVLSTVTESLPSLLDISIPQTALLLDRRLPSLHENVMSVLADRPSRERFLYLRTLLASTPASDDFQYVGWRRAGPSKNVPAALRTEYLKLLCENDPEEVVHELQLLPTEFFDRAEAARVCEEHQLYEAVIWCINDSGDARGALKKVETFVERLGDSLVQALEGEDAADETERHLASLKKIQQRAVDICKAQSKTLGGDDDALEDNWFELLRSQITCVHRASLSLSSKSADASDASSDTKQAVLQELRSSVHETFNSLLSVSSTTAISFPRLFKRLVDVRDTRVSKGAQYTEFRAILGGMLESYRSEGDMLVLTKHLMSRDLFVSVEALAKARVKGWAPSRGVCSTCGERLHDASKNAKSAAVDGEQPVEGASAIIVSRTGAVYHRKCLPGQDTTNSLQ